MIMMNMITMLVTMIMMDMVSLLIIMNMMNMMNTMIMMNMASLLIMLTVMVIMLIRGLGRWKRREAVDCNLDGGVWFGYHTFGLVWFAYNIVINHNGRDDDDV